jgi:hypothetical protein
LLCAVGTAEKCQDRTACSAANKSYSITSSARESSIGGTSRPSILAV